MKSTSMLVLAFVLLLAGCTTSMPIREGQVSAVKRGTVVSLTPVTLSKPSTGIGSQLGGLVGTFAGASQGRSFRGVVVGAMVGQAVGLLGGRAIEEKATETPGFNVGIRTDGGEDLAVAQSADDVTAKGIAIGSRVRVVGTPALARLELD